MCAPLAAVGAMAALSAAASATQYAGQKQAANAQQGYENEMYSQTAASALQNLSQQYAAQQQQLNQQTAATQQQAMQNVIAGEAAKGTAKVAQGARNVSGNSAHEALLNFSRIERANDTTLKTNLQWAQQQAYQNEKAMQAQAQSGINAATPQPVVQPSAVALGLQLGGTALRGYDTAQFATQSGVYNPSSPNALKGGPLFPII